jgi:nucleoside-diphosphate-sugar epimerase
MNILVTGSKGFIGTNLVTRLNKDGHNVYDYDLHIGDLTHLQALDNYSKVGIDHIFHLAGKTYVPESWSNPGMFYSVNVLGTNTVLEFCRKTRTPLTYISSYLYGSPKYLPIDEKHPIQPSNPYSHSKHIAEQMVNYFTETFQLKTTVFRPFNAYGPGQPSHFIIPEIISKTFDSAVSEIVVNDLRPKRNYIYIDDIVDALILSISGHPGIYNLGSGFSTSIQELITLISQTTSVCKPFKGLNIERRGEIFDLYADITYINKAMGWAPKTLLQTGIKKCIDTFRKNNSENR